jgi:hypothetical protein
MSERIPAGLGWKWRRRVAFAGTAAALFLIAPAATSEVVTSGTRAVVGHGPTFSPGRDGIDPVMARIFWTSYQDRLRFFGDRQVSSVACALRSRVSRHSMQFGCSVGDDAGETNAYSVTLFPDQSDQFRATKTGGVQYTGFGDFNGVLQGASRDCDPQEQGYTQPC